MAIEHRALGATEYRLSPIGLGAWQFSGGKGLGAFWGDLSSETVREVVRVSLEHGVSWIDTAEIYGGGRSEDAVADALKSLGVAPGKISVATKWFPLLRFASSITRTLPDRIRHLGGYPIALHQVHMPTSLSSIPAQMKAMAAAVRDGAIGAVGVSNFSAAQMRKAHAVLKDFGIPLASNQVSFSLVNRAAERNGVLEAAKELGITIIAYSPLGQGILTGKFHTAEGVIRPDGMRRYVPAFSPAALSRREPLVRLLREVGAGHGATPAQVALAWLIRAHGDTVVAIPGARSVEQARSNALSMTLELTAEEIRRLSETAA